MCVLRTFQVQLLVGISILEAVQPLRVLHSSYRRQLQNNENRNILRRVLENLASTKLYLTSNARKYISPAEMSKSRNIYEAIARNRAAVVKVRPKKSRMAQNRGTIGHNKEFSGLVEQELLSTVQKQTSALLDKPHLEKKGRNDYLVFNPGVEDPYVTIIPNNIYYNIEKKCANWLDDCSLKGIRERLLQRENSPFK